MATWRVQLAEHSISGQHRLHRVKQEDQTGRHCPPQEHLYPKQGCKVVVVVVLWVQHSLACSPVCSNLLLSDHRLPHNQWDSPSWWVKWISHNWGRNFLSLSLLSLRCYCKLQFKFLKFFCQNFCRPDQSVCKWNVHHRLKDKFNSGPSDSSK